MISHDSASRAAGRWPTAARFAFCDEAARMGLRGVSEIAPALVNNPFWDFWWD